MTAERVHGVILDYQPFHESHRLVDIFTSEKGIMRVIAHGAQKPQHPLFAVTKTLTECYVLVRGQGTGLWTIDQGTTIATFPELIADPVRLSYALSMGELLMRVADRDAFVMREMSELYPDFRLSCKRLEEKMAPGIVFASMLVRVLPFAGLSLQTAECSACGGQLQQVTKFSVLHYGGLCTSCAAVEEERYAWPVSAGAWRVLTYLSRVPIQRIGRVRVTAQTEREVCRLLSALLADRAGISLRSLRVALELDKRTMTDC